MCGSPRNNLTGQKNAYGALSMNITSACKLFFTDACILQLKKISYEREESVVLRIRVISGGCAGLQYTLSLEPSLHLDSDSDIAFTKDGVIAVADDISIKYIAESPMECVFFTPNISGKPPFR